MIRFYLAAIIAMLWFAAPNGANAATRITATVTLTNSTVNGNTFVVNGSTRTWTNTVYVPSTQVLTNTSGSLAKTNLTQQISSYPFTSVTLIDTGTNSFQLAAATDIPLTVTLSGAYATVSYSTNTVSAFKAVRVPISGELSTAVKNEIASGLVDGLNSFATNAIYESSVSVSNLVGRTNSQSISGAKQFQNSDNTFWGSVTNSPYVQSSNVMARELWFYDNSFSVAWGSNVWKKAITYNASNLTFGAFSTTIPLLIVTGNADVGGLLSASNNLSITYGSESFSSIFSGGGLIEAYSTAASATNKSGAFIATNNIVSKDLFATNSASLRNVAFTGGTNSLAAHSDISYPRYSVSSLASGNNAAVPVGTNVFVEVSGPGAAFTICGLAAGNAQRDGKIIYIVNQTGFDMTIAHQSGVDATAANRIITSTGADRSTTGNGTATLIYDGSRSRWILLNLDQ